MNNVFDSIQVSAKALKIDAYATDVAVFAEEKGESYRGKNLETYSITTAANRNK
ncbi:MAG: hypothetical protein K6A37_02695 [Saccharofermentans sp.]|nr:hypothetical protein [Saccharofermentans sp.]